MQASHSRLLELFVPLAAFCMQSSQGTWTEFLRVPLSRCEESVDTPLFGRLRKAIAMTSDKESKKGRVCAGEEIMNARQ